MCGGPLLLLPTLVAAAGCWTQYASAGTATTRVAAGAVPASLVSITTSAPAAPAPPRPRLDDGPTVVQALRAKLASQAAAGGRSPLLVRTEVPPARFGALPAHLRSVDPRFASGFRAEFDPNYMHNGNNHVSQSPLHSSSQIGLYGQNNIDQFEPHTNPPINALNGQFAPHGGRFENPTGTYSGPHTDHNFSHDDGYNVATNAGQYLGSNAFPDVSSSYNPNVQHDPGPNWGPQPNHGSTGGLNFAHNAVPHSRSPSGTRINPQEGHHFSIHLGPNGGPPTRPRPAPPLDPLGPYGRPQTGPHVAPARPHDLQSLGSESYQAYSPASHRPSGYYHDHHSHPHYHSLSAHRYHGHHYAPPPHLLDELKPLKKEEGLFSPNSPMGMYGLLMPLMLVGLSIPAIGFAYTYFSRRSLDSDFLSNVHFLSKDNLDYYSTILREGIACYQNPKNCSE